MKKIIYLILMLCLINIVTAVRVGTIVEFPDGSIIEECILLDSGKTAYDAFKELDSQQDQLEIKWSGIFPAVYINNINGIGYNEYGEYKSWAFSTVELGENLFNIPPEKSPGYGYSYGDYVIDVSGKIIGLSYATVTFGSNPPYPVESIEPFPTYKSYDGLCPNMFIVNITKIYVDGEKQSESKTRRGKIVDVFPESEVKFKIELENLYHHSTDIEITDISIEGIIEEILDGDDIEEEIKEFDLKADKKTNEELKFTIPLEVEEKDRLLRIEIEAEDDAGIKYEKEFKYDLEVEKENHKLKILKAELDKDSYKCGENALFSLLILNIGAKDEDVNLQITNEDLEIDIKESFELSNDAFEESSKYENRFNIWLPENIDKATYPVTIIANYGSEEETTNIDLVVSECEKKESTKVEEGEEVTDVQTGEISEEEGTEAEKESEEIATIREKINKNLPFVLTAVLGVLIVLVIVLLVIFWAFRK